MTADRAADDTVGTSQNVDVEVRIDLQGGEDNEVERVDRRAVVIVACVEAAIDLRVETVVFQGLRRLQVEGLDVEDLIDQPLFVHLDDLSCDAAEREVRVDVLLFHPFTEESHGRERRAAGTHLHRESVIEVAGVHDDIRRRLGDQEFLRVLGVPGRTAHDAARIADVLDRDDVIDLYRRDTERGVRIRNQIICDDDDLVRILRVDLGITEGTAHRAALLLTDVAVGIAEGIAGRCTEERHVDVEFASGDRRCTAAVRTENDREVHQAAGDLLCELPAHAAGLDVCDNTVLDMFDHRGMAARQRAGCDGQVFDAHSCDLIQHHVDDVIAVSEMVVERNGHAVLQAGLDDRFVDRFQDLARISHMTFLNRNAGLKRTVLRYLIDMSDFRNVHLIPPAPLPLHRWDLHPRAPADTGRAGRPDGRSSCRSGRRHRCRARSLHGSLP